MPRRSIFISHAHKDHAICERYVQVLRQRGFDVWYDLDDLPFGASLDGEIAAQLKQRFAFLVILTRISVQSYWVNLETSAYRNLAAQEPERIIIPLVANRCNIPMLLEADAIQAFNRRFEDVITEVIERLESKKSNSVKPLSKLSRRDVLLRLAGVGVISGVVASGLAWSIESNSNKGANRIRLSPTPTIPPTPGVTHFIYRGHSGPVNGVSWSPGGSVIASAGSDSQVHIWDATNGTNAYIFKGHQDAVRAVTWSNDGKFIASGGDDMTVQAYDATGNNWAEYPGHKNVVNAVSWALGGKQIVSGSDDTTARIWNYVGGDGPIYTAHSAAVKSVGWQPTSQSIQIASASEDKTIHLWSSTSATTIQTFAPQGSGAFPALAWSPDGNLIVAVMDQPYQKPVIVWNVTSKKIITYFLGHIDFVLAVAWSSDGKRIASGGKDQTVQVWDAMSGQHVLIYHGHSGSTVTSISWSPDGKRIASSDSSGAVHVWFV